MRRALFRDSLRRRGETRAARRAGSRTLTHPRFYQSAGYCTCFIEVGLRALPPYRMHALQYLLPSTANLLCLSSKPNFRKWRSELVGGLDGCEEKEARFESLKFESHLMSSAGEAVARVTNDLAAAARGVWEVGSEAPCLAQDS